MPQNKGDAMSDNASAFEVDDSNKPASSAFEVETPSSGGGSAFEVNEPSTSLTRNSTLTTVSSASGIEAFEQKHTDHFELVDKNNITYRFFNQQLMKDQGAMGVVSTATWQDGHSKRKVLIKRLNFATADEAHKIMFSNESAFACDHGSKSNLVVSGICRGENDGAGNAFLVLEFYEGETLDKAIKEGKFVQNPDAARRIMQGILEGVTYLHDTGIIHRDLKPANIMIRKNGLPVILDLGLALSETTEDIKAKSIGTKEYAAPEQLNGGHVTYSSDIYGIGMVFLEMLTGSRDRLDADKIPEEYKSFVIRCMKSKPEDRFQYGREALEAFNKIGGGAESEKYAEIIRAQQLEQQKNLMQLEQQKMLQEQKNLQEQQKLLQQQKNLQEQMKKLQEATAAANRAANKPVFNEDDFAIHKNKYVALALCLFFGWLGAHRFYEGKYVTGIIYLCSFGLFGFGILIDLIILLGKPAEYKP